jgi:type IV pilus assembly protein PilA
VTVRKRIQPALHLLMAEYRRENMMNRKGFTLIELMIVVAIIGILAAIAIPNFIAMQLRAKRSELPTNVDGIRTAEKAYHHEWDAFTTAVATPGTVPGRAQVAFTSGGFVAFENLGWTADGKVRGMYDVVATNATSMAVDDFLVTAIADVDGDGSNATYTANRAEKAKMITSNNVY